MTADTEAAPENPPRTIENREVEWQMAAADLGLIRRWLTGHAVVDGLTIKPCAAQQLHDTYLDTSDWRIFRAGYALRTRRDRGRNEVTLKSLHSARADVADRRELSEALESDRPDAFSQSSGPVMSRVQAVAGAHPLRPLFEVRTRRERFAIQSGTENEQLGEIALDESVILHHDGKPAAGLQRVEVEALSDQQKPLEKLVKRLRANCALEAAPQSKYELGLRSIGLAPATGPQLEPVEVDASMHASEVALARLRKLFTAWFIHEPGARLGDDPERLHDLRTAARRIDATLGLYAEYLPRSLVRSREKIKILLHAFGVVRDFDVQLGNLARFARELGEADRTALAPLQRHLESERTKARSQMLRRLDSESTRKCLDDLMTTLAQPSSLPPPQNDALAVAIAPELIEGCFRKLRKDYRSLTEESSLEDYHAVRGRAKKLRYALEIVAPICGKPAEQMLRSIRRLQDELGAQQDAHVTQQRLLTLASAPREDLPPCTLFLMGRFAEQCAGTGTDSRKRLARRWRKVRGRRWKELRSRLEELRERSSPSDETAQSRPALAGAANEVDAVDEGAAEAQENDDAAAVESGRESATARAAAD